MGSVCCSYYLGGGGVDFRSYADWLARRQYVINVIWRRTTMKIKDCRTNYISFIQNCDVPEKVSGTFDLGVDLNGNAAGTCRSRYEWFYSVRSPIMRQKI